MAEMVREVNRLVSLVVDLARSECREVPGVGRPEWWDAPPVARVASVLVLGEAFLRQDSERREREWLQIKGVACDLAESRSWRDAARLPSHSELQRRRAEIPQ